MIDLFCKDNYEQVEVNSDRWLNLEDLLNEVWKDIEGFEGLYQISNYGRVKSLGHKPRYKNRTDKILRPGKNSNGYWLVILYKNKIKKTVKVHRLVISAFVKPDINRPFVDHIEPVDNNICNNSLYNLRWSNAKENHEHSVELGRHKKPPIYKKTGKDHCHSKPVIQFDLNNTFIKQWYCIRDIQKELGYVHQSISDCCNGKTKTAYKFKWKFGIYESEVNKSNEDNNK